MRPSARRRAARVAPIVALAAALVAADGRAQEYHSETRASEPDGQRAETTGSSSVVDLDATRGETLDLAEVVERTPSADVERTGGLGAPAYLSIRGADPAHVRVLLDGVPIGGGQAGAFDLSSIPVELIGRVTVYRSAVPVQLGAPLPGGALDLETRFDPEDGSRVHVGGGSFGTRRAAIAQQATLGRGDLLVSAVYAGAENDFPFFDDGGTPLNPDDDGTATRLNADYDGGGLLLRHRTRAAHWRLTTIGLGTADSLGLPGLGVDQAQHAGITRGRAFGALRAERSRWPAESVDVALVGAGSVAFQHYRDLADELGLGAQDDREREWRTLVGVRPTVHATSNVAVRTVLDYGAEGLVPDGSNTSTPNARRDELGFGAELDVEAWDDRLELALAGRGDLVAHRVEGTDGALHDVAWAPHAGAALEPWTDRAWSVRGFANIGIAERLPGFFELYGDRGTTVGNPSLRAERRLGVDLGVQLSAASDTLDGALTWAFFDRSIDDLIVFVQNGLGVSTPVNVGRAAMRGHELSLDAGWLRHVRIRGTYTLMDALDRTAGTDEYGNRLPGRPVHAGSAALGGGWDVVFVEYSARAAGELYLDRQERRPVPARLEHDLTITIAPPVAWRPEVALVAHNLGDLRVEDVRLPDGGTTVSAPRAIADVVGQPLPGRAFYATLTLRPGASPAR